MCHSFRRTNERKEKLSKWVSVRAVVMFLPKAWSEKACVLYKNVMSTNSALNWQWRMKNNHNGQSPLPSAEVKEWVERYLFSPICLLWRGQWRLHFFILRNRNVTSTPWPHYTHRNWLHCQWHVLWYKLPHIHARACKHVRSYMCT